jgi:hypothetical protein
MHLTSNQIKEILADWVYINHGKCLKGIHWTLNFANAEKAIEADLELEDTLEVKDAP